MPIKCHSWKPLDKNKIQCHICPHNCILEAGQIGLCRVRQNREGQMHLLVYGKCSGLSIDPIEKKPLYHFYPGSQILSFGTNGCNLDCKFCQNWSLSKSDVSKISLTDASPHMIALKAKETNCLSVAFTYNEPIIFSEYVEEVAHECKKQDIKTVMVSAGYINPEARTFLFKNIDAANIDMKSFSDNFYRQYCSGRLQPVLDTLQYLKKETNIWLEITNLLINGLNDSEREITKMCEWVVKNLGTDVPFHFSAFHGAYQMSDYPKTSIESLKTARSIALSKGLKYVYLGNIADEESSTTYCDQCHTPLIKRRYLQTSNIKLRNANKCPKCSKECSGRFKEEYANY